MYSACWTLRACSGRSWCQGRRLLIEQRNGFKKGPKKPERGDPGAHGVPETMKSSFTSPMAEAMSPARSHIMRQLYKPFLFTLGFSGCSFGVAAIWQYETLKSRMKSYLDDIQADWLGKLRPPKHGVFRKQVNEWWNSLSEGQKTVSGIIALNGLVFCLWRVPSLQRTMIRYFTSNPASHSLCLPMVLSTFSHFSLFHMAANMYVLWSFSTSIVSILGKEQFLAVYLSAGTVSTFVSYVSKIATGRFGPSLGASGAIMTILAAVCTKMPEAKLAIIFLPMFTFTAGNALKAIMAIDAAGLIMGWKFFDHAAHLGGALFGVWYAVYGNELIWRKREPLVKMWHEFRNGPPRSGAS
ncbi:presenilins-associated rhomboid-like protein, mitochondrial [Xenopus laevis]|uniref:rhomboid protease n=2 Tax=Xenopus laevis TaxID=8355 RepID=A0A1L8HEJ5_XENLA|nr:presenilins-associated rhomboid-like protein, mitochondrial [Xenopus laevis]OCT94515.1 hypothetical protein XELAEV_18012188mg [Xenopus laevis]